ncbi:MAG: hypothetical protein WBH66_04795 [Rectinemataceae bacterium]
MERRTVLSVIAQINAGVLSRVSGLFSRHGYSIDNLIEHPKLSGILEPALTGLSALERGSLIISII